MANNNEEDYRKGPGGQYENGYEVITYMIGDREYVNQGDSRTQKGEDAKAPTSDQLVEGMKIPAYDSSINKNTDKNIDTENTDIQNDEGPRNKGSR